MMYSDITVLLDRSGSMQAILRPTISGFNEFLNTQKQVPGKAKITLVQFDDRYEPVYTAMDIQEAPELNSLNFVPRGMTALNYSLGRLIDETGRRLSKMPKSRRPDKVIFVVVTDGMENHSHNVDLIRRYTAEKVREMVKHQENTYNWEFVYLGANQDAIAVADSIGIKPSNSLTYVANTIGTESAYASLGQSVRSFRMGYSMNFNDSDREKQKEAGA